jgi:hypothetical protein
MTNSATRIIASLVVITGLAILCGPRDASAQSPPDQRFELTVAYGTNRDLFSTADAFAAGLRLAGLRDVRIDNEPADQRSIAIAASGSIGRYVLPFSEFLYNDLGQSRVSGRAGFLPRANFTLRTQLFEWTSGVHLQVPAGTWRVRPYVGGGAGLVRARIDSDSQAGSLTMSAGDFTYHADLGVKLLVSRAFAIAPEFRVVEIPDDTYYRVLVGAVFRFE